MVWMYRDGLRKAKAQMEWDLAGNVKNNKKEFYKSEKKGQGEWISLNNQKGEMVSTDLEKTEVLNESSEASLNL